MNLRQINFSVFVVRDGSHVDAVAATWQDGKTIGMETSEALQRMTVDELAHFWAAFEALATEACAVLHEKTGTQQNDMAGPDDHGRAYTVGGDDVVGAEILGGLQDVRAP